MAEKEKISEYSVLQSVSLGENDIILAEKEDETGFTYTAAICGAGFSAPSGADDFIMTPDYLEALKEFADMVKSESIKLELKQRSNNLPRKILGKEVLDEGSGSIDMRNQLVILDAHNLSPEYRSQASQVVLATGGFGCSPTANGRAVKGIKIATGERVSTTCNSVLGVANMNFLPDWVPKQLKALGYIQGADNKWAPTTELKLYCPLHGLLLEQDGYGDWEESENPYDNLVDLEQKILEAIRNSHLAGEEDRGLMAYFNGNPSIDAKVYSYYPTVETIDGRLYGVIDCKLTGPLTQSEMAEFKDEVVGQLSDGWGEGFEQHGIKTEEGEVYVSFWSASDWDLTETPPGSQPEIEEGMHL